MKKRSYIIASALMFSAVVFGSTASAMTLQAQPKSHFIPNIIAKSAAAVACSMHSIGWCYAGVKQALRHVGVNLWGDAAWQARDQLADDKRFRIVERGDLRKGDILVHGRSKTHPYGHIAVYLGHDEEASDHLQKLIQGGTYGATVVFRPRGKQAFHSPKIKVASLNAMPAQRVEALATVKKVAPPVVPPPLYTAAQIAAARTAANEFRQYYKQGVVSRIEVQQKVDQLRNMELACHLPTADSFAVTGVPID